MNPLDQLEADLKERRAAIDVGLGFVSQLRKTLDPNTTLKVKVTTTSHAAPLMSEAAKRKQRAASKAYWAKVKSGEIKRRGYKGSEKN